MKEGIANAYANSNRKKEGIDGCGPTAVFKILAVKKALTGVLKFGQAPRQNSSHLADFF